MTTTQAAAMDAEEIVVELAGVEKSFTSPSGQLQVLTGVNLSVTRGEIVGLAGRSGSGKTALLTIVAGWEHPDAGSVVVLGDNGGDGPDGATRHDRRPWRDLAILPQSLGLLDELTVAENVTLPLRLDAIPETGDPGEMMARLGIDHLADRFPSEVSLGEQQRAALARAAIITPRLLLADEPIAHQNHAWAEGMMLLLGELAANGTACPTRHPQRDRIRRLPSGYRTARRPAATAQRP
ncbi:MAG: ATP-binding cassette domain-containing protein [Acidimicrobiales bacterium]